MFSTSVVRATRALANTCTRRFSGRAAAPTVTQARHLDQFKGKSTQEIEGWVNEYEENERAWVQRLDGRQYSITREGRWEPGWSEFHYVDTHGTYCCAACSNPLFSSNDKFVSEDIPWPNFNKPISDRAVTEVTDRRFGLERTEIQCGECQSRIGHVYRGGEETETGDRYTTTSQALTLTEL